MMHKPLISAWAVALIATLSPPLRAHDFWMEPSDFHPRPGTLVSFTFLAVFMYFAGQRLHPLPYDLVRMLRLFLVGLAMIVAGSAIPLDPGMPRVLLLTAVGLSYPFLADRRMALRFAMEMRGWLRR